MAHPMDFSVPGNTGMVPNMPNYHESQHFSVSMDQVSLVDPIPFSFGLNTIMVENNSTGHDKFTDGSMGSSSICISNQPRLDDALLLNSIEGHGKLPTKRKAEIEHVLNSPVSQHAQLLSMFPENLGANDGSFGSVKSLESQRKTGPVQHNQDSPVSQTHSGLSKRKIRSEPIVKSGLQRGRPPKKQTAQVYSATKSQPESSVAVRSKMRESMSAALALASQKPGDVLTVKKDKSEHTITHQMPVGSQPSESHSSPGGCVPHSVNGEVVPSQGSTVVSTISDSRDLSCEISPNTSNIGGAQTFQEWNSILPDGDVQFSENIFVKDDLLQGNELSWAFDFNAQMEEGKEAQNADKPPSVKEEANFHGCGGKVAILTPENLAFKIEAELFKLFGGINKKYKEKGRSLLFNLKDQKNPELRERVMSGHISPEILCSMTADELASKELAEWRIAKAEEMAQMVVLPDTQVDMRRLVKKTHKGEYQVEFEHDDGIADEVSSGSSMQAHRLPKKEIGNQSPAKPSHNDEENIAGQEKASENHDFSGSLIIPADGSDLMQGMMVDEFKDVASLPPIVSLDEFMESLNSEPPFENLSEDAVHETPLSHKVSPKKASNTQASGRASISPRDAPSRGADVVKKYIADMTTASSDSGQKTLSSSVLEVEYIWEGVLQLSISSVVTVRGLFQSGEKTPAKKWSPSLEIKGRVRLDAFEKFLQDLPMSRTRALMILQFVLKDNSSENQGRLSEAVDLYAADERPGFAEPAPGVELYVCPPTPRIAELLNKHMLKEGRQIDSSMENGLIGVVVWRRAHISSSISPNASSNHKHSLKKQPFSPSTSNVNVKPPTTRPPASVFNNVPRPKPLLAPEPKPDEDDDDVPPGFGPGAKDVDDLPEFSFSGGFNSSAPRLSKELRCDVKMTPTPVDHVRELIKKYGQSDAIATSRVETRGIGIEPWDDDEDDIPEWRPEALNHLPAQPYLPAHNRRFPGDQWPRQQPQPRQHMHGARWRKQ